MLKIDIRHMCIQSIDPLLQSLHQTQSSKVNPGQSQSKTWQQTSNQGMLPKGHKHILPHAHTRTLV